MTAVERDGSPPHFHSPLRVDAAMEAPMAVEPQNKTLIPLHIFPARLTPVTSCAMLSPRTPSGLGKLFIFLTAVFP